MCTIRPKTPPTWFHARSKVSTAGSHTIKSQSRDGPIEYSSPPRIVSYTRVKFNSSKISTEPQKCSCRHRFWQTWRMRSLMWTVIIERWLVKFILTTKTGYTTPSRGFSPKKAWPWWRDFLGLKPKIVVSSWYISETFSGCSSRMRQTWKDAYRGRSLVMHYLPCLGETQERSPGRQRSRTPNRHAVNARK